MFSCLFVFLLEGFDGVEAAGGADLNVAGAFCSEEKTFHSDKDKVIKKVFWLSEKFSRFSVKSVYFILT